MPKLKAVKWIIKRLLDLKTKFPHTWYGNEYGGFYVCPEMLLLNNRDIIVYSCGVGEDVSFDTAIMNNYNCSVFAFDPTPKSIEWIKKQNLPENFIFIPIGISDKTEKQCLHLSNTPLDISASIYVHRYTDADEYAVVQMKSLADIAGEYQHSYVDILKMDIEGSEFAVIRNLPENVIFGQIVVEFHERFLENGEKILKESIKILKKRGYYCFAISERGDEYSFVNKKEYIKRVMNYNKERK